MVGCFPSELQWHGQMGRNGAVVCCSTRHSHVGCILRRDQSLVTLDLAALLLLPPSFNKVRCGLQLIFNPLCSHARLPIHSRIYITGRVSWRRTDFSRSLRPSQILEPSSCHARSNTSRNRRPIACFPGRGQETNHSHLSISGAALRSFQPFGLLLYIHLPLY